MLKITKDFNMLNGKSFFVVLLITILRTSNKGRIVMMKVMIQCHHHHRPHLHPHQATLAVHQPQKAIPHMKKNT